MAEKELEISKEDVAKAVRVLSSLLPNSSKEESRGM